MFIQVGKIAMQAPGLGGGKVLDSSGGRGLSSKSKMLHNPAFLSHCDLLSVVVMEKRPALC